MTMHLFNTKTEGDKTIESVVKNELCTGCGTCAALCPTSAIKMLKDDSKGIYLPKVDCEKCNKCGICYQACPGHFVDFKQLNQVIFGKEPEDILVGSYLNCYIGHATDYNIRYNSASGGLVTALLIFALEEGLIDGALVTKMNDKNPLVPQTFIAKTRDEIISASKSIYCPVPANIALKEIHKSDGKFAVVGIPCHLHGIRKAEMIDKELKEKIVLHIGLFCSHTPNFLGTTSLFKRLRIKKGDVVELDYRGEGWPGYMKISLKDGELLLLLQDYWGFVGSDFFTPRRCLMCSDNLSELADISFGDAWLSELSGDKIGKSIIVSRTNIGEQFLQEAMSKNIVELESVTADDVKLSQLDIIHLKKKCLIARLNIFRSRPLFNANLLNPDFIDYLLSLFLYFNHLISQNHALRMLLEHTPRKLLTLYHMPYNVINNRKIQELNKQ
jgi:coenzyme F420 hydrogenase subunit beta